MKRLKLFFLLIFVVFSSQEALGQIVKSELLRRVDLACEWVELGAYDSADIQFNYVLKHLKPLPSKVAYYYGRNSYHLGYYKRAINWLNKYLQLKGSRGTFHLEVVEYLKNSEVLLFKEKEQNTLHVNTVFQEDDKTIICNGSERITCPVCKGEGIVLVEGPINTIYKICPYSMGNSYLTCEEYILLLRGELQPKIQNQ